MLSTSLILASSKLGRHERTYLRSLQACQKAKRMVHQGEQAGIDEATDASSVVDVEARDEEEERRSSAEEDGGEVCEAHLDLLRRREGGDDCI